MQEGKVEQVRIDKWLWAARFFKSRQLAQDAINGGKVHLAASRIKPSRMVGVGDCLQVRKDQYVYELEVLVAADKRVSAKIAQTYYKESQQSIENREALAMQIRAQSLYTPKTDKKPDKKSRRRLISIKKS